jgi:REP element-mobilizing transposase RayT
VKFKPVMTMFEDSENTPQQRSCYYLTLNVVDNIDIFIRPVFKQVIVESLNYFISKKGLTIYGWCLMTNHLHLLVEHNNKSELMGAISDFKNFTGKIIWEDIDAEPEVRRKWIMNKFMNKGKLNVWEPDMDVLQIDWCLQDIIGDKLDHIHLNPVRDRIVLLPEDYLYSSARDYNYMKGLVNIELADLKKEMHLDQKERTIYNMMWYR